MQSAETNSIALPTCTAEVTYPCLAAALTLLYFAFAAHLNRKMDWRSRVKARVNWHKWN